MLKLKVKQAFNDWEKDVRRFEGDSFEVTTERYDEMTQNFKDQGYDVADFVEIVEKPKKKAVGATPAE